MFFYSTSCFAFFLAFLCTNQQLKKCFCFFFLLLVHSSGSSRTSAFILRKAEKKQKIIVNTLSGTMKHRRRRIELLIPECSSPSLSGRIPRMPFVLILLPVLRLALDTFSQMIDYNFRNGTWNSIRKRRDQDGKYPHRCLRDIRAIDRNILRCKNRHSRKAKISSFCIIRRCDVSGSGNSCPEAFCVPKTPKKSRLTFGVLSICGLLSDKRIHVPPKTLMVVWIGNRHKAAMLTQEKVKAKRVRH